MKPHGLASIALISTVLSLLALCHLGCHSNAPPNAPRAEYVSKIDNVTIAIEIIPIHPFFAEYDRFAVLFLNGREVARRKLFPDSGGYATSNFYRCGAASYMVQGYFDVWTIDVGAGTITEGKCQNTNAEYIGVFDGGGSRKPWTYYPSSERRETTLVARGG